MEIICMRKMSSLFFLTIKMHTPYLSEVFWESESSWAEVLRPKKGSGATISVPSSMLSSRWIPRTLVVQNNVSQSYSQHTIRHSMSVHMLGLMLLRSSCPNLSTMESLRPLLSSGIGFAINPICHLLLLLKLACTMKWCPLPNSRFSKSLQQDLELAVLSLPLDF